MTVFLGTLCCSNTQIEAPYGLDWEDGIALHPVQSIAVSVNLCSFLKEVKPLVQYDVEHGIAMKPMKGNGLHLE